MPEYFTHRLGTTRQIWLGALALLSTCPWRDISDVVGVARFRDSRALANDAPEIVCVRAWKDGALLRDGVPVDVVSATGEHRVFAFMLTLPSVYTLHGVCALVESPVVFAMIE